MNRLDRYGYSLNLVAVLLWPLSLLFGAAVRARLVEADVRARQVRFKAEALTTPAASAPR